MSSQDEIKSRKQNSLALMGEHGFELNDIIVRALPYLRFDFYLDLDLMALLAWDRFS